jgi:hypothetical protein
MNIGDKVIVTKTPYWSVQNGVIANIIAIKFPSPPYPKFWACYILDTEPSFSFKIYEIKKLDEQ